jgi:hypothetical protein
MLRRRYQDYSLQTFWRLALQLVQACEEQLIVSRNFANNITYLGISLNSNGRWGKGEETDVKQGKSSSFSTEVCLARAPNREFKILA